MSICIHCGVSSVSYKFTSTNVCFSCASGKAKTRYRSKKGIIRVRYLAQKSGNTSTAYGLPSYTFDELYTWACSMRIFHRIYNRWEQSGYIKSLAPSFDRLNDYKPYSLDNLRIVTWEVNKTKGSTDRVSGVNSKGSKSVSQYVVGVRDPINTYHSMCEAHRCTNIPQGNISKVCNGERKLAGGFIWRYIS